MSQERKVVFRPEQIERLYQAIDWDQVDLATQELAHVLRPDGVTASYCIALISVGMASLRAALPSADDVIATVLCVDRHFQMYPEAFCSQDELKEAPKDPS